MKDWMPDVFEFMGYRDFMRAYYSAAKTHTKRFSYRSFSAKAGFSSSNFIKMVIDGDRNLSPEAAERVAAALELSASEQRFFKLLVEFEQATDHEDRLRALESITATKRFLEARPLDSMLLEYLSHWYNLAIRELAGRSDFKDDPEWIAAQLRPKISTARARKSLELLVELGLLERADGVISRGEPSLDAGHEVRAAGVKQFHRQMLERAAASIDDVPSEERDISAMTVCIKCNSVEGLKERLREFRETFMSVCDEEVDPDVVYQLNIQFFPLSEARREP
jgi:uncharacterized protein (TIGR02147 family)